MGQCISTPPPLKVEDSTRLKKKLLRDLVRRTLFTKQEIREWHAAFLLAAPGGRITFDKYSELILKTVFKKKQGPEFVDVNSENLMRHVDLSFRQIDTNSDRVISFSEFIIGMSRCTKGNLDEKITYAFSLYDIDKDGIVSISEMREILMLVEKAYGGDARSRGETEKFIEFIFNYLDSNNDGVISVGEFIVGVKTQPELLNYLTGATDTLASLQMTDFTQFAK